MVPGSLEYICDKDSFNKYAKRENAEIVFDMKEHPSHKFLVLLVFSVFIEVSSR